MFVQEIMSRTIVNIPASGTVFHAATLLREHKVGSILAIDDTGDVGIVTKRDIIYGTMLAKKDPVKTPVSDIMTRDIKTIHPLENVVTAVELMEHHHLNKLVVIKNEEVVGIITFTDIARAIKTELKQMLNTWHSQEFGAEIQRNE